MLWQRWLSYNSIEVKTNSAFIAVPAVVKLAIKWASYVWNKNKHDICSKHFDGC